MDKHTGPIRRLAAGGALMALVAGAIAAGQAAAPTAPHVAPTPPAPPAPPAVPAIGQEPNAGTRAELRAAMAEARAARREAMQAQRDALREKAEAMREAAEARREALAEAARVREEAFAERAEALRDMPGRAEAAVARVRARMAAKCAAKGFAMPEGSDIGALAGCGRDYRIEVRTALINARNSIADAGGIGDAERAAALEAIDRALSELRRAPMHGPSLQ